jgi:hypothetical protein
MPHLVRDGGLVQMSSTPYVWTASAEEFLAKVQRARLNLAALVTQN